MQELGRKGTVVFYIHAIFHYNFLLPIGKYVNWKLKNDWDDYNELYHAIQYIENIKKQENIWFETHTMEKNNTVIGVVLIVGGALDQIEGELINYPIDKTLLLKYFHVVDKGNGYGTYWLHNVILPLYKNRGFEYLLVSSSHPKSFNFYRKLGKEVRTAVKKSDNGFFQRIVKSFCILLK
ncbi:MAG: hypothetical protein V7691_11045 [Galbibacter orientalis]|uniref:hypothetical protein n=1 Tax=Galbibacter orientalis TaxID=453852 RepID=UPI0030010B9E